MVVPEARNRAAREARSSAPGYRNGARGCVVPEARRLALRGSGGGPYGAVKAALHAFAYDLAHELGPRGGTASVVAPGLVPDTEFWAGSLSDESRRERAAQTLVGRGGDAGGGGVAHPLAAGPDGGWMTGQVLSPNGRVVLGR